MTAELSNDKNWGSWLESAAKPSAGRSSREDCSDYPDIETIDRPKPAIGGAAGCAHATYAAVALGRRVHVGKNVIQGFRVHSRIEMSQLASGSVTRWIPGLKRGDQEAQTWLLARYYQRVLSLAEVRLGNAPRRAADEEDVASEVFHQFLNRAQTDGFRQLEDRIDLEDILLMLTRRRATDSFRTAMTRRKFELGESAFGRAANGHANRSIDNQPSANSTDSADTLTREIAEIIRGLFHSIECEELKLVQIAMLRLQGFSADEIADQIGELRRTVYRRLELIRTRWQQSLGEESANLKGQ